MATKSKFFRAFVEGGTISDSRVITAKMIDEIVETFSIENYTPRINIEHIAGYSPEPPFNGYGDVVAVRAQDDEFTIAGQKKTQRALYCQVDANDQLVTLAGKDQKPFPSIELTENYAGTTGKIGLVGLAFTDTPASMGTQRLQFSRSAPGTVFACSTEAAAIEFEPESAESRGIAASIKAGFSAIAASIRGSAEPEKLKPEEVTPPKAANDNFDAAAFATQIGEQVAKSVTDAVKPATDAVAALRTDFAALSAKVEATPKPNGFRRDPATGGEGALQTNC